MDGRMDGRNILSTWWKYSAYPWALVRALMKSELNVLTFSKTSRVLSSLISPLGKICPDFNTKETICM